MRKLSSNDMNGPTSGAYQRPYFQLNEAMRDRAQSSVVYT